MTCENCKKLEKENSELKAELKKLGKQNLELKKRKR